MLGKNLGYGDLVEMVTTDTSGAWAHNPGALGIVTSTLLLFETHLNCDILDVLAKIKIRKIVGYLHG
jgi:hypothetical protein